MLHGRKALHEDLLHIQMMSPLSNVSKSEVSSRSSCVIQCAAVINNGDPVGGLKTVLVHTDLGKKVLKDIRSNPDGFLL
jgi:hypothetical protein